MSSHVLPKKLIILAIVLPIAAFLGFNLAEGSFKGWAIVGALALEKTARSLLYGLEGHDPLVVTGSAVVLALVALGAGYLPARRASKIHPMQALRYE